MKMKRTLTLVILLIPLFVFPKAIPPAHAISYAGPFHIAGNQLVDSNGAQVQLIGTNYGDHPNAYASPYLPATGTPSQPCADGRTIHDAGFNAVNLVVEWGFLENSLGPSQYSYTSALSPTGELAREVNCLTHNPSDIPGGANYDLLSHHTTARRR